MSRTFPSAGALRAGLHLKTGALCAGLFIFFAGAPVAAAPIVPQHDDEVIEVLPAVSGSRAEERRARRALAAKPRDATLALATSKRYFAQAHELGDPRFVGQAMAVLAPWDDASSMPDELLLMKANLQQYLHEFDDAAANLKILLARPGARGAPQAWLTLATIRRVQGRYAESDTACREVGAVGAALHSQACLAENAALRGELGAARKSLATLLAQRDLPVATRTWLLTTLAELEQRDGRAPAAEALFREVLRLETDSYALTAYADFLIDQRRPLEALKLMKDQPRTDGNLLRLAIAGAQARTADGARDIAEMRERIALANERPEARMFHGREQAMFALAVEQQPAMALELARGNVEQQREPLDLLVLARAARASGDAAALAQVRRLRDQVGLHDRRIDALL